MVREDALVEHGLELEGSQLGHALVEVFAGERAGGSDDRDLVARTQPRWLDHAAQAYSAICSEIARCSSEPMMRRSCGPVGGRHSRRKRSFAAPFRASARSTWPMDR